MEEHRQRSEPKSDDAVRRGARKGLARLCLIVAMGIAEVAVINRFGSSAAIWPVLGAISLFVVLNRLIDF